MRNNFCVLFDMDGVILDTETQYCVIWKHVSLKYNSGIDNLEYAIKGTTLPNILEKYFSHLTDDERKSMVEELYDFERKMDYNREIDGAFRFVNELKKNGIKVGLVTSSNDDKLSSVYKQNDIRPIFDTIVSANRITKGKPDPMCYLLAAQDLGFEPKDCFVFEDSFAGIESGRRAGMTVVALSTTHPDEELVGKAEYIIPDFSNFTIDDLYKIRG